MSGLAAECCGPAFADVARPAVDPMRASAKDGPRDKAKDAPQWDAHDHADRDPRHWRCIFQAIGWVYLVADQQIGCCLASQERNQVWVGIIRAPWASAVVILALEAIPESLNFLVRGGHFEFKHN